MNNKIAKNLKEFDKKFNIIYSPRKGHFGQEWDKIPSPETIKAFWEKKWQESVEDIIKCIDEKIKETKSNNEIKFFNDLKNKIQKKQLTNKPAVFFFITTMIALVIAAIYLGKNVSYKWTVEDLKRNYDLCIQDYTNCRQGIITDFDRKCQKSFREESEEELSFDEYLYYNPVEVYEPPPEPKEPQCLDLIGWGNEIKCYKWSDEL